MARFMARTTAKAAPEQVLQVLTQLAAAAAAPVPAALREATETLSLYEGGSYAGGSLSLASSNFQDGSNNTFTLHDQDGGLV